MKQRHISWVCVGTNTGETVPTWFYAFRTYEDANAFVSEAKSKTVEVNWDIYPCELMSVEETVENFTECLGGE